MTPKRFKPSAHTVVKASGNAADAGHSRESHLLWEQQWVDVTWTPPGEEWPRERIEKSHLQPFALKHYDNPSQEIKQRFRAYYKEAQRVRLFHERESAFVKICDNSFVSAWLVIHDPQPVHT